MNEPQKFAAFTDRPSGGNPTGVWMGERLPSEATMLSVAAEVGFSETVFAAQEGVDRLTIRFFSPKAEVPFCGHATIALGARLAIDIGPGRYVLDTVVGEVLVEVDVADGVATATLTSVDPHSSPAPAELVERAVRFLEWTEGDLDRTFEPTVAFGGANHLVLAVSTRERLADVRYDFDAMNELMLEHDLTTVSLVWRESASVFHARNLFPVGGVVEDPATGAAAAALGGHLRSVDEISVPGSFEIRQGVDMGRPSLIRVSVPPHGGIGVTGAAVRL